MNRLMVVVRWVARVWGFFLLIVAISELGPDPNMRENVPWQEFISPAFLLGGAVMGWLLAWRWERLGGSVMAAGWLLSMIAARLYFGEWLPGKVWGLTAVIFALPGLLFLWYGVWSQKQSAVPGERDDGVNNE